jgi:chromosome segregation ATPase
MLGTDGEPGRGAHDELEHAYAQELAANRDLVRKCAELDEVIGRSQQLLRELISESDRLRAELMAAKDLARKAERTSKDAEYELRRLRKALEHANAEVDRLSRVREQQPPPPRSGSSAQATLRRLRNKFAKDYHPDHAPDAQARQLRQEVFKHVWSVFEELDRAI